MSAGSFVDVIYETNNSVGYAASVQPETLTLTLNGVANVGGTTTPLQDTPSAIISGSSRRAGVNMRKVRVRFTGTLPPGYVMNGTITLPVLTPTVFASYARLQTGTYTLEGVDYDVAFVGKTGERIN